MGREEMEGRESVRVLGVKGEEVEGRFSEKEEW